MSSTRIKDLPGRPETQKTLERRRRAKPPNVGPDDDFSDMTLEALAMRENVDAVSMENVFKCCVSENSIDRVRGQPTEWATVCKPQA